MGKSFRSKVDWSRHRDFTIGGPMPDGSEWEETFGILPTVPPEVLDETMHMAGIAAERGLGAVPPPMMIRVIRRCIMPVDGDRFDATIADTRKLVDPETWSEVFREVLEVVVGDRPSLPSSASTSGGSSISTSWTAPASEPVSTSVPSTPAVG